MNVSSNNWITGLEFALKQSSQLFRNRQLAILVQNESDIEQSKRPLEVHNLSSQSCSPHFPNGQGKINRLLCKLRSLLFKA